MNKLNLNPIDGIQTAEPEMYSEFELLNALDMIWKNRKFVEASDIEFLERFAEKGIEPNWLASQTIKNNNQK